jgi:hypothetical protein
MRSIPMVATTIVAAIVSSCALSTAVARAESANPAKVQALARLQEGNTLLGQGRATDALAKFTEAYHLFPSSKLHYNIGQAQSLIPGHEVQAYESMSRFLTEAVDANPELRGAAEAKRQQLRPKVALVSVTADPPDADLIIDDVNVGRVTGGVPAVMGIGTHRLALKKGAAASIPRAITIAGGESFDLLLRLSVAPAVAPPLRAPPALDPTAASPAVALPRATVVQVAPTVPAGGYWSWQRGLGAGLAGLAAVSLAAGVIEHLRYFGKKNEFVNQDCGTDQKYLAMRPDCRDLQSQFKSANTWWVTGYVAAAVLGGTGAYFLWLAPADSGGSTPVASVNSGMTVTFEGRF